MINDDVPLRSYDNFLLCKVRKISVCNYFPSLSLLKVAGYLADSNREGSDCSSHLGLAVSHCQHIMAGVVFTQSFSQVAAPGPALSDLLWHVRLHGCGVYRWVWGKKTWYGYLPESRIIKQSVKSRYSLVLVGWWRYFGFDVSVNVQH